MTEPLVVTAVGSIAAAGVGAEALMDAMIAGADTPAGAIEGFDAKRWIERKGIRDLSRLSQLACSAAAMNARGIAGVPVDRVGVVFGTAWGSLKTVVEFEREAHVQGARFVDPILFTETVSNVPAGQVAILYGWSAFNATIAAGSASGVAALRQAVAFLDEGRGSVAVAGGGDASDPALASALRMRGARGPVDGEGACFLTIEAAAHARGRGAPALAAIRATAARFDEGTDGLVRDLVARAAIAISDIELVVTSAATREEAAAEERGVEGLFGKGEKAPAVLAPKLVLGETWGASGVLAAALAIETMRTSRIPRGGGVVLDRPVGHALILDRTQAGQRLGLVLSRESAR